MCVHHPGYDKRNRAKRHERRKRNAIASTQTPRNDERNTANRSRDERGTDRDNRLRAAYARSDDPPKLDIAQSDPATAREYVERQQGRNTRARPDSRDHNVLFDQRRNYDRTRRSRRHRVEDETGRKIAYRTYNQTRKCKGQSE
jgi:hypothetical protein